jgi:hypothetical protein
MFEWHFTIKGPPDSPFEGGRYHGRILLPSEYPYKPPDIVMMTVRLRSATACCGQSHMCASILLSGRATVAERSLRGEHKNLPQQYRLPPAELATRLGWYERMRGFIRRRTAISRMR